MPKASEKDRWSSTATTLTGLVLAADPTASPTRLTPPRKPPILGGAIRPILGSRPPVGKRDARRAETGGLLRLPDENEVVHDERRNLPSLPVMAGAGLRRRPCGLSELRGALVPDQEAPALARAGAGQPLAPVGAGEAGARPRGRAARGAAGRGRPGRVTMSALTRRAARPPTGPRPGRSRSPPAPPGAQAPRARREGVRPWILAALTTAGCWSPAETTRLCTSTRSPTAISSRVVRRAPL
jgi:hypothetical protein